MVRPPEGAAADTDTFSATLRALQSVGTTSRVLSADVPSLNGKPAQFYELLKTAYLKEISTKTTETGSETTLKPGEVSSGFGLSYTARITAPDEVLVRLVVSLRDRPTFAVFGTSQAQIQLPVYADRGVQATQRLRRGETPDRRRIHRPCEVHGRRGDLRREGAASGRAPARERVPPRNRCCC